MLILLSHRLTLKGPIHDSGFSSIMCSHTPTDAKNTTGSIPPAPRWQCEEGLRNEDRWHWKKCVHDNRTSPGWIKGKKNWTYLIILTYLRASIFLPSCLFLSGILSDRAVRVCYRKQSRHNKMKTQRKYLTSLSVCTCACVLEFEWIFTIY